MDRAELYRRKAAEMERAAARCIGLERERFLTLASGWRALAAQAAQTPGRTRTRDDSAVEGGRPASTSDRDAGRRR